MKKSVACALAMVMAAVMVAATAPQAAEATDLVGLRYYGSDFIAGNAMGFAGAFILTNPCHPCDCGCYHTYPHYYFHHFHYPDRLYHSRADYRS